MKVLFSDFQTQILYPFFNALRRHNLIKLHLTSKCHIHNVKPQKGQAELASKAYCHGGASWNGAVVWGTIRFALRACAAFLMEALPSWRTVYKLRTGAAPSVYIQPYMGRSFGSQLTLFRPGIRGYEQVLCSLKGPSMRLMKAEMAICKGAVTQPDVTTRGTSLLTCTYRIGMKTIQLITSRIAKDWLCL